MSNNVFDIEKFNVISDNDNYYFFRALNNGDNSDIETGITTDEQGNITTIRTDRARYTKEPKYSSNSSLSLEEMFDHIKMHHRRDTNCISLTTNANVALLYGREFYQDKYIMVRVPKSELGNKVVNAGEYLINEVTNRINALLEQNIFDDNTIRLLQLIDHTTTKEELDNLINSLYPKELDDEDFFERGITYTSNAIGTVDYQALTKEQNFEKDKIVAKLNIIGQNIIPNVSNKFLVQTIGNAFSSLELAHYQDINQNEFIELPKELVDIFSLLQQMPENYPNVKELKQEVLNYAINKNYSIPNLDYIDVKLDTDDDYTIERMYNLTNGDVDFNQAINLYKKSFYLAKSKLLTKELVDLLTIITNNNPNYLNLLNQLKNQTFRVEPTIFSKTNSNKLQVSESVNLDFNNRERELFNFINNLSVGDLHYIINNPLEALNFYLTNLKSIEHRYMSKEEYYANAIIDLFDWEALGVVKFDQKRRNDLVNKLIQNNIIGVYESLKRIGIKEKEIANTLLTTIIKEKSLDSIDLTDTFSAEELDDFLGYYRINNTKIKLRSYQATALRNINKSLETHQFTSAILPTGAGKSFVALAKMLEMRDKEILYLAPNDVILNQIKDYIIEYITGDTTGKNRDEIIKEVFPNLKLKTYYSLLNHEEQLTKYHETIDHKYDLIIMDELHRSGATEWNRKVLELLGNQDENTKVLGITATPERDVDYLNMADEWARYFNYTEEEIASHKHIAVDMDLEEAIKLGYVVNPKVVSCEYSLASELDSLNERINNIPDETEKKRLILKLDNLRKRLETADGVEKVLGDNLKLGGRYIVFCPVVNNKGEVVEDEDGIVNDGSGRITGKDVIKKYTEELKKQLKAYYNVTDEEIESMLDFYSMLGEYSSSVNENNLKKFEESNPNKIKFMVVMNKLNEGSHAKNDGLIWFRPLDENSRILFSQQLGRIIYSVSPNKPIKDEDRPIAIDLPCNIMRVKLNKREKISDLERLKNIESWIIYQNGRIPDLNSFDRVESSYGSSLKHLQEKYSKYLSSPDLLTSLSNYRKLEVLEILTIGNNIGLWSYDFPDKILSNQKSSDSNLDFNDDPFGITGILSDYSELIEDIEKYELSFEDKLAEYIELLNTDNYKIIGNDKDHCWSDGSSINYFWDYEKNKTKIIDELTNNPKYKEGYETAKEKVNKWIETFRNKVVSTLTIKEKIVEYIELLNTGDYEIKKNDTNHYWSDGSPINYFWDYEKNKTKIIDELTNNPNYKEGYETAKEKVNKCIEESDKRKENKVVSDLTIEEKIAEYIELLNTSDYEIKNNDTNHYWSDGSPINQFWSATDYKNRTIFRNRTKIIDELTNNPKYKEGYETAKEKVNKWIEESDKRKENNRTLTPEVKIKEYIELLNTGDYKISTFDSKHYWSIGTPIKSFWRKRKNEVIQELYVNLKYKEGYETAKEKVNKWIEESDKRKENNRDLTPEAKIKEYIELLNTGDYEIKNKDKEHYWSDGNPINYFWEKYKTDVNIELKSNPKYESGYDVAKLIVNKRLEESKKRKESKLTLTPEAKIKEYIELLNTGDYEIKNKDKEHYWSDGNPINYFWSDNETKIRDELDYNPKYKEGYETARKMISYKQIDKIAEYIEMLNNGYVPKSYDPTHYFSDGSSINYFWSTGDNKQKIIDELNNNPKYANGYETARKMISDKQIDKFAEKLAEYIEMLNNGYVPQSKDSNHYFSDGSQINRFWSTNKTKIIDELNTNQRYEKGYDIAKAIVNKAIEKSRKTANKKLVKELCIENNIDTKINKNILNKAYDEVYAKICYLKEHNIPITENGVLHEIFFIADINMQIKYKISLEELINEYTKESTRGK